MHKPLVTPAKPHILSSIDHPEFKPEKNQNISKLETGEYYCTMPMIGTYIDFYGNKEVHSEQESKLTKLTNNILEAYTPFIKQFFPISEKSPGLFIEKMATQEFQKLLDKIQDICSKGMNNEFFIRKTLIPALYNALSEKYIPWDINKEFILLTHKPVFSSLVKIRAAYAWLGNSENPLHHSIFQDLLHLGLDQEAIDIGFAQYRVEDLDEFEKMLCVYLEVGADINSLCYSNPNFGTFLHLNIANEFQEIPGVIAVIEKCRVKNQPNTQFKYILKDASGNTPLLLALRTRNELAALALIDLDKDHCVGINIADSEGRSPLMLACAYGMKKVVAKLLEQGADVCAKDKAGKTYKNYASIDRKSLEELITPFIHPHRVNSTASNPHSYLHAGESPYFPLCYYEDGQIQEGMEQKKHFLVLSNDEPYKGILIKAIETLSTQKDEASQCNTVFALKQVDDIRFSAQYKRVLDYLKEHQEVSALEARYLHFNQNYKKQDQLYAIDLDNLTKQLETLTKENTSLQPHLNQIQELKNSLPAISFLELCIEGEKDVRTYLAKPEVQESIALSQEKATNCSKASIQLKEIALRHAAALGDLARVQALLEEKVKPTALEFKNECDGKPPSQNRDALIWATWSGGMVDDLIRQNPEYKYYNREAALEAHPKIIKALLANSVFSSIAINRVKEKLNQEICYPTNLPSQEHAAFCLDAIENPEGSLTP